MATGFQRKEAEGLFMLGSEIPEALPPDGSSCMYIPEGAELFGEHLWRLSTTQVVF